MKKKPLLPALVLLAVCSAAFAGGGAGEKAAPETENRAVWENVEAAKAELDRQEKTIVIKEPQGKDLGNDSALSYLAWGILIESFSKYSGMNVPDMRAMALMVEESETGNYSNEEELVNVGEIKADYFLIGTLIKVSATQYTLQLTINDAFTGNATPWSVPRNATRAELRDGTAVKLAAKDLLTQMGVRLTPEAETALAQPIDGQTIKDEDFIARFNALPTEYEKLQYYYEEIAIDPSLKEKAQWLSTYLAAFAINLPEFSPPVLVAPTFTLPAIQPVSTGNIGADARERQRQYEANKATIKEQQQTLLRQRQDILDQWQDFLGQLDKQRGALRDQEQRVFQRQRELVATLRKAEAFYADHPPFRIIYDQKTEPYGAQDFKNATMSLRFKILSEPGNVDDLKFILDALENLNKSFTDVNAAYEDINREMTRQFGQVEAAMAAVKDALDTVNRSGKEYDVAAVSTTSREWNIPPGTPVYGTTLTRSWPVDYPRTFSIAASLLNDTGAVIGRGEVSLANGNTGGDLFKPERAFGWCVFNDVKIDAITDTLTVRIDTVNKRDVARAAAAGYIAIDADEAQIAAIEAQIAAIEAEIAAERAAQAAVRAAEDKRRAAEDARRNYWMNSLNSLGVAIGTAFVTPAFLVSPRITFSPFPYSFLEAGADFGLVHGEWDVRDVEYRSIAPYLNLNFFVTDGTNFGGYIGAGGGASLSRYTYPSESLVDPVTVNTAVFNFNAGMLYFFPHSAIVVRYTLKTNFKGHDHRATLGYMYRFGSKYWR